MSYPYALERPYDPGSPHLEPDAALPTVGPTTPPPTPSTSSSSPAATPTVAPVVAPAPVTGGTSRPRAAAGERPRRGKGGARKLRQDAALDAELAGITPPAAVDEQ